MLGILVAIGIISTIVISVLQREAVNNPVSITASPRLAVMVYAPALRWSCWFLMFGLMALGAATLLRYGENLQAVRLFYSFVVVLLGGSVLLLIEVRTRKIMLTDEAIASFGRLSKKAVKWSEVDSIQFNRWLRMLVIHTNTGNRLRVNPSLSGMEFLEFMASEKLTVDRYSAAFRELAKFLPTKRMTPP
jgi:hypothetical protein